MKIKGNGFLSESGQRAAEQIVSRHAGAFCYLERVISELRLFASSQEQCTQNTVEDRQKIIALVLVVRILELSEAALLVMKNGMSNEANTIFRAFLDAYFVLANICNDALFVANYIKSDATARLTLLNVAAKHNSEPFRNTNEYGKSNAKEALKKMISEEGITEFNSYNYAKDVGCTEIYDSMYRIASASLHTTPRSLEKYVDEDEFGAIQVIKDYPLEDDIPQLAYDLAYFLIKSFSGLKDVFGRLDTSEIENMIAELEASISHAT